MNPAFGQDRARRPTTPQYDVDAILASSPSSEILAFPEIARRKLRVALDAWCNNARKISALSTIITAELETAISDRAAKSREPLDYVMAIEKALDPLGYRDHITVYSRMLVQDKLAPRHLLVFATSWQFQAYFQKSWKTAMERYSSRYADASDSADASAEFSDVLVLIFVRDGMQRVTQAETVEQFLSIFPTTSDELFKATLSFATCTTALDGLHEMCKRDSRYSRGPP